MIDKKLIVVITGPSGVGKSEIEKILFADKELNFGFSISATTRAPRINEINGESYYFISENEFNKRIDNNDFVEWNQHFNNKYGTLKSEIIRLQSEGKIPFLEIEVIGAENIIRIFPKQEHISIFIAPPTIADLRKRILNRNSENENEIKIRLDRAQMEMSKKNNFDHVVINDIPTRAANEIKCIILNRLSKNAN